MFSPKSSPNIHLSSYLNIFNLLYICVYVNRDRAPSVSVVFMCALRMRGSERRKGTPLRKRTNKDTFRCLITIWSTGIARRGLNELIFVNRFLVASWKRCHSSSGLVCLSLFCFFMSFQTDWMMIRSDLCVEHWLLSDSLCKQKSHWIITINSKMNVWKCKLIFTTDTLQQKIEITDLKPFFSWWKY